MYNANRKLTLLYKHLFNKATDHIDSISANQKALKHFLRSPIPSDGDAYDVSSTCHRLKAGIAPTDVGE